MNLPPEHGGIPIEEKYILFTGKVYEIDKISFYYMTLAAHEINMLPDEILEKNILDITGFKGVKATLTNKDGKTEVFDLGGTYNK